MIHSELLSYLNSDANEYGLDVAATHGFLCATVIGPTLPDWQNIYFDGYQDKVPADIIQALESWQQRLLEVLQLEEEIVLPFMDEDEDGDIDFSAESDLTAWSIGFIDAMYGSESTDTVWFSDEETSDDVAMLTLPMMVFSGIDVISDDQGNVIEQDEDFAELRQDNDALAQMANSIQKNLVELYLLFHTEE